MTKKKNNFLIGNNPIHQETKSIEGEYLHLLGEKYYRISNYDQMPPFFMNLVSSADHWLFIASTGGLTAGRTNVDSALFPYETEDKIISHHEENGSKTIIRVTRAGLTYLWEPFSDRYAGIYRCDRHLYKNIYGNKLIFEEINYDLQLSLRTAWFTGDQFGFIRSCWLHNRGDQDLQVELLDGLQNILPYGATKALQDTLSSLMNAYKRNELDSESGLGIFALSATLSDRAEPSEALKATVVWQVGLDNAGYLLSGDQLDAFRMNGSILPEQDICGKPGAYFVHTVFDLPSDQKNHWQIIADVNQDSADIVKLKNLVSQDRDFVFQQIEKDISQGTENLVRYVAAADGVQSTAEEITNAHHFANVLFNVMRGGIYADGYWIERDDFLKFVNVRNRPILAKHSEWFRELPERISIQELYSRAADANVPDLIRLCYEYLPLSFSRRHGDPSRPWNSFSINLKQADGNPRLDYQGNWRDIFQNWEPLAYAFPYYVDGIIAKFLNATTADGYNPYRVTRAGIEWEVPAPDDPWSNIGYWGDHQIIYMQKLLEIAEQVHPGALTGLLNHPVFAYANVPFRLHSYAEMVADWNNTIEFDWDNESATEKAVASIGTDGRLLRDKSGAVIHATMAEKLLVLLLAKLTNLVPEGGIWMNTQRPEWNDANNALAGKGLSVVTVAYLRRFITFWAALLAKEEKETYLVNSTVASYFLEVRTILLRYEEHLETGFSDQARRAVMDDLGSAASAYRAKIYNDGLPPTQSKLTAEELKSLLTISQNFIDHTLRRNQRPDGLFHSYNTMFLRENETEVNHLYLMLEGQVALLSSGMLTSEEALNLLKNLRESALFRVDQYTYLLYPNRDLPGFQQKNNIPADLVSGSEFITTLVAANDRRLIMRDEAGVYHFNGSFRNKNDVVLVLDHLAREPEYADLARSERVFILDLFEMTFNHRLFTGRSGTFFAYEGLGSVYWHMVSKLLLAAQECYQKAVDEEADASIIRALGEAYYDVRQGLGFNKTPLEYGAFPTDPYSHTPLGGKARQPGMTGQVKEEILTRMGELGVSISHGVLCFAPTLVRKEEFFRESSEFLYIDFAGNPKSLSLPPDSLAFTVCQTPVVYLLGDQPKIEINYLGSRTKTINGSCLDQQTTQHIFDRNGQVEKLQITVVI